jgi:plasmid stabilization system protein ParE
MPQIKIIPTPRFIRDLERVRIFLHQKSQLASKKASATIRLAIRGLAQYPESCRVIPENPNLRELVIPFGDSGYIALYEYYPDTEIVSLLTIKHQKEDDYC